MTRVLVLGGGMVGLTIATELASRGAFTVTVADADARALGEAVALGNIKVVQADLSQPFAIVDLANAAEIVVGALPGQFGFAALQAVIESRRPFVDISFMPENPLALDAVARERGVTAIVDCGVAPGVSHMMAGFAASHLSPCDRVDIYVGGLPIQRLWPFDYKAGFSPRDVIEEYVRPARLVEHGRLVTRNALSDPELIDFPGVGTLEAFLTDGLRTLLTTVSVPNMKEKTLRYPGHRQLMEVIREIGFFSQEALDINGQRIRPLDVTAALMFPKWQFQAGEPDVTVLRVVAEGNAVNGRTRLQWDLCDTYETESGVRSMSRVTAFAAVAVLRLLAEGRFVSPGVHPPEALGAHSDLLEAVLTELRKRGVRCTLASAAVDSHGQATIAS